MTAMRIANLGETTATPGATHGASLGRQVAALGLLASGSVARSFGWPLRFALQQLGSLAPFASRPSGLSTSFARLGRG